MRATGSVIGQQRQASAQSTGRAVEEEPLNSTIVVYELRRIAELSYLSILQSHLPNRTALPMRQVRDADESHSVGGCFKSIREAV